MSSQKSHGLRFHIILLWRQWEMCKLWEVVSYEKIGLKSLYCIVALKVLLVKIILAQSFILYRPHMMWQLGHILIYAEFIKTKILCFRFFFIAENTCIFLMMSYSLWFPGERSSQIHFTYSWWWIFYLCRHCLWFVCEQFSFRTFISIIITIAKSIQTLNIESSVCPFLWRAMGSYRVCSGRVIYGILYEEFTKKVKWSIMSFLKNTCLYLIISL